MRRALTAALAAATFAAPRAAAQVPDSAGAVRLVDSLTAAALARTGVAGIAVAVARRGTLLVQRGAGWADVERRVPVDSASIFRVGSVTKQVTAALVMREVERGRVDLDAPVTRYVPDAPVQGRRVLVRQLLNHTSGMPSYTALGERWSRQLGGPFVRDSFVALVREAPWEFEPGEQWRYSNSGYWVLGLLLERVTGVPYATLVQRELAGPLGLPSLGWCDTARAVPPATRGYARRAGALVPVPPVELTHPFAAGALCATAGDLVRWADALAGGRVVQPASYARMTTPDTLANGSAQRYGFGLMTGNLRGHRVVTHNGAITGYAADVLRLPDDSLTVAVLVNTDGPVADALATDLALALLGVRRPALPRP